MIREYAGRVIDHVDVRDYPGANVDLDSIEANVRSARDQIANLELESVSAARPAGENP